MEAAPKDTRHPQDLEQHIATSVLSSNVTCVIKSSKRKDSSGVIKLSIAKNYIFSAHTAIWVINIRTNYFATTKIVAKIKIVLTLLCFIYPYYRYYLLDIYWHDGQSLRTYSTKCSIDQVFIGMTSIISINVPRLVYIMVLQLYDWDVFMYLLALHLYHIDTLWRTVQ